MGPSQRNASADFARAVLQWYDRHGRHSLPWKVNVTPYRVWISEVMLQQTQVKTVIPYYERFMASFPDVRGLADAPMDDVLHHWTGLGYYARGRNLHRAARWIRDNHQGEFPTQLEQVMALPGIGRSTAGAILALACDQHHAILDGNAKRVLARYHAVTGWPGQPKVERELWALAQSHTPAVRVADYTQAMMDLGATVCSRTRPACLLCPLVDTCRAHAVGEEKAYPSRKPKRVIPTKETVFVIAQDRLGRVLLERRPPAGIWGGLWGFPEVEDEDELRWWTHRVLNLPSPTVEALLPIQHGFSHYKLNIQPWLVRVWDPPPGLMEGDQRVWYKFGNAPALGMAAPVAQLVKQLSSAADANPDRTNLEGN